MNTLIKTERLLIREIFPIEENGMFELDSDPEVHRYLGNKPVKNIEQCRDIIQFIRQQYIDNGIGRWAIIEKQTNNFVGWTGFKLVKELTNNHINYYDLGYRLIKKYWGQGYASESARACLDYGFNQLQLEIIYATADVKNLASINVIRKLGFKHIEIFDRDGTLNHWFELIKTDWNQS